MSDKTAGQRQAERGEGNKVPDIEPNSPAFRKVTDVLAAENGAAMIHNFDGDKMNQYRLTAIATGGGAIPFDQMPVPFDLKYWFCHRVEMVAQGSGEIITPIRTALIDKSGNVVSFVSDGIARELDQLRSIFGDGPYTEPMPIKVTKIPTRSKTTTYTMGPA